jgi:hypothetical protein
MVMGDNTLITFVKGNECYMFLYSESNRTELLRLFGRFAADNNLSFSWYDAAVLSKKVRDGIGESVFFMGPQ